LLCLSLQKKKKKKINLLMPHIIDVINVLHMSQILHTFDINISLSFAVFIDFNQSDTLTTTPTPTLLAMSPILSPTPNNLCTYHIGLKLYYNNHMHHMYLHTID
jgi:hypothetical protein